MTAPYLVVAALLSPVLVTVALAAGLCGAGIVLAGGVGIVRYRLATRPAPAGDDYAEDLPAAIEQPSVPHIDQPTVPPAAVPGPVWDLAHLMHSPDRPLCGGRPGCMCEATDRQVYGRYAAIVAAERAREADAARRAAERRWGGGDA